MSVKDYYNIIGVKESADQAEIKKKYRELAKKYHPDANPGNKAAEEKFKEISEAYDIIGDPQKRQKYDQMRKYGSSGFGGFGQNGSGFDFSGFGSASSGGRGFSFDSSTMFGSLGSLFAQFFDMGERGPKTHQGPKHGQSIHVDLTVPFEKAVIGGKVSFKVNKERTCTTCGGGGAKPGSRVQTCPECKGTGVVVVAQGAFGVSRPCPRCFGKGQIIENPCDECRGSGKSKGPRTYAVNIPEGAEDGRQIRLKGEGQPGDGGRGSGDMIVTLHVKPHRFFKRRGNDVYCEIPLTLKQAALGTKIKVKTVYGKKVLLTIPKKTPQGKMFRLKNMGIKQGDQLVTVKVKIPDNPTEEEKEYINQIAA